MPFARFPTPIRDELPYSMLARYAARMPVSKPTMAEAFGTTNPIPATLPNGLAIFQQVAFQKRMSLERLIAEHTGLPYLTSLMPLERRQEYVNYYLPHLSEGATARRWKRAGLQGTTPHRVLLFCPGCVENDLREEDQAAWHRVHQLPGVVVCPRCAAPLRLSEAKATTKLLRMCPTNPQEGSELPRVMSHLVALRMARCTEDLLKAPLSLDEHGIVQRAMRVLIIDAGLDLAAKGAASELLGRVVEDVGTSSLVWGDVTERSVLDHIKAVWRTIDLEDHRSTNPLSVVAVLAALDLTVEDLRRAIDGLPHRPPEASRQTRPTKAHASVLKPELIERHRARILRLLRPGQRGGAGALWTTARTSMLYLSKHDRQWLEEQHAIGDPEGNLAARDAEMAQQTLAARDRLLDQDGTPQRITANKLVLESGISREYQTAANRAGWPLLAAAIEQCLDSNTDIVRRRLEWRACQAVKEGREVKNQELLTLCQRHRELDGYARDLVMAVNIAIHDQDPEGSFKAALVNLRCGRN